MGGCLSRPQVAPPVPQMPQAPPLQRHQSQSSSSSSSSNMQADTPSVEHWIQQALAYESETTLFIAVDRPPPPSLTVNDARRFIDCARENPRFHSVVINGFNIHNDDVLNVFRNGLPLCTSVTSVALYKAELENEELERLLPAFYNTSVTTLGLHRNNIQGRRGGEAIRVLLVGNDTLRELLIYNNPIGPEGSIGLQQGLAGNTWLQKLYLVDCSIGNDGLANLLPADGIINNSLLDLNLTRNSIEGEDGGRKLTLLLQRFPALKVLNLNSNDLGPASALAPGLAAASQLQSLELSSCRLGNEGVANLILPDGRVNSSLTNLNLSGNNIQGAEGGRQVSLLLQCFQQLKKLCLGNNKLGPLGTRALAPGLAAASHLERLELYGWRALRNDGVANLIPEGQVNRSLTHLDLRDHGCCVGEETVVALASRCTNLESISFDDDNLSPDQRRRLDMLLDRNRLIRQASALGGSTFPVLFRFVEKAHRHEQGLSAIFVILQNDGDDYFCTALSRAME